MKKIFIASAITVFCLSYFVKPIETTSFLLFRNYLFDFAFPLFFPIAILMFWQIVLKKDLDYGRGVQISMGLACLYEVIQLMSGTGDMFDFGAYFLAGIIYWVLFYKKGFYIHMEFRDTPMEQKT